MRGPGAAAYTAALFAASAAGALLFDPSRGTPPGTAALTAGALAAAAVCAVWLKLTGRLTEERAVMLLIAAGFFLRLGYGLYTPAEVRQHDVRLFGGGSGHAGYIEYILDNGRLPDFDPLSRWQFYHPPLHHVICACWMKLLTAAGFARERAAESLQFLTLFYSSVCMVLSRGIFRRLGLRGAGMVCAMAAVCFSPAFIMFSGSINNDILSITLTLAAAAAVMKWCDTAKAADAVAAAVFLGLGMSAKMSAAYAAPAIAAVFLIKLISARRAPRGTARRLAGQYALFGAVVFPLGLWWPVRNAVKFGTPPGYVPLLGVCDPQYVGGRSVFERLFIPFGDSLKSIFFGWGADGYYEYNVWSGLFKSSVFGEFDFSRFSPRTSGFDAVLFWANAALALAAFAALALALPRRGRGGYGIKEAFLHIFYAAVLGSYLIFCFGFPHTCSMNIRYASPLIVIGAAFLGKFAGRPPDRSAPGRLGTAARAAVWTAEALYCVSSAAVYILLGVPA